MQALSRYEEAGLRYYQGRDLFSDNELRRAWMVYMAARQASEPPEPLGLVVGGIRDMENAPSNDPGIDGALKKNFMTMDRATAGANKGSGVLSMRKWSVMVNDSWVLGGVHSNTYFYLASRRTRENLYDTKHARIRVFCRELIGIASCGYQFESPYENLGEVLNKRHGTRSLLRFSQYQEIVTQRAPDWEELAVHESVAASTGESPADD